MSNLIYSDISEIKNIRIFGRLGRQRQPLPLLFNGSGIEVVLTGSELWIDIETDSDFHEPWVAYEINGAFMGRQMLLPGEHRICLFRNMEPTTPKRVRFYRELQAMGDDVRCKILVKGLEISDNGCFCEVPKYERRIEFIGDSITSGEGSYGAVQDVDWLAMYMSASVNYATMTAKELEADYHLISQGGWGVYCGWDNDPRHNIPSIYEKVCGFSAGPSNEALGCQDPYDFDSWQPDVIVVNLGTNDISAFSQPPFLNPADGKTYKQRRNEDGSLNREDELKIEDAIVNFLTMLRKHSPKAHIAWCYGMLFCDLNMTITEAMSKYREKTGDNNISFFQLPDTTPETYGAHMHPGRKSHENGAKALCQYLRAVMNW
ncbi:MAG: SGNH/GDSL hydrolase family protein [Butyrivibrio sp.]|nr:SGNH/GDSL hydrolase family protein [Butyrivibrio sp.]